MVNSHNSCEDVYYNFSFKIEIYELFSGFPEVEMSLKTDVSTSFGGPLQVVKKL